MKGRDDVKVLLAELLAMELFGIRRTLLNFELVLEIRM